MSDTNKNCYSCSYCDSCSSCSSCYFCSYCSYCSSCYFCSSCDYCSYCDYSKNLRQSEYVIFGLGNNNYSDTDLGYHREYMAFNKRVTKERFSEISDIVNKVLLGLKFNPNEAYTDNWKQVTREQWIELSKIAEFDKSVVDSITGLTLNLEPIETIIIGGLVYDKKEVENQLRNIRPIKQ